MNRNAFKVPLLNRDGKINTEMLPNYDENDKLRADYANYANYLVTNNTKINVGSSSKPIYFNGGKPVASSTSLGNSQQPIYMQSGEFKACDNNIPFYSLIERTELTKNNNLTNINKYFSWRHFPDATFFNNTEENTWNSLTTWMNGDNTGFTKIVYNGFVLGQSFSLSVRIDLVSGQTDDRVIRIKGAWIKSILETAIPSSLTISSLYYDIPIATPRSVQAHGKTPTNFTYVGPVGDEDQVYIGFDGGDYTYGVNVLIIGQVKYA